MDFAGLNKTITETAWERGWSDAKDRLGSVQFWFAEVIWGGWLGMEYHPMVAVAGVLLLGIVVIAVATITAPLRQRDDARRYAELMLPNIEVSFDPARGGIVRTPEKIRDRNGMVVQEYEAIYIRPVVRNMSRNMAQNCAAFLTHVEKKQPDGSFKETAFIDPLQLGWSLHGVDRIGIHYRVNRHIDLVRATGRNGKLEFVNEWPLTLRALFDEPNTYRFTVLVITDDSEATARIDVHWTGKWEQVAAEAPLDGNR